MTANLIDVVHDGFLIKNIERISKICGSTNLKKVKGNSTKVLNMTYRS